jgi:hypothetical protein
VPISAVDIVAHLTVDVVPHLPVDMPFSIVNIAYPFLLSRLYPFQLTVDIILLSPVGSVPLSTLDILPHSSVETVPLSAVDNVHPSTIGSVPLSSVEIGALSFAKAIHLS